MEHIVQIVNIETRAKNLNLTPTAAYRRAGVNANSFSRWKLGRNSPNLRTYKTAVERVEAFLAAEEIRLAKLMAKAKTGKGEEE